MGLHEVGVGRSGHQPVDSDRHTTSAVHEVATGERERARPLLPLAGMYPLQKDDDDGPGESHIGRDDSYGAVPPLGEGEALRRQRGDESEWPMGVRGGSGCGSTEVGSGEHLRGCQSGEETEGDRGGGWSSHLLSGTSSSRSCRCSEAPDAAREACQSVRLLWELGDRQDTLVCYRETGPMDVEWQHPMVPRLRRADGRLIRRRWPWECWRHPLMEETPGQVDGLRGAMEGRELGLGAGGDLHHEQHPMEGLVVRAPQRRRGGHRRHREEDHPSVGRPEDQGRDGSGCGGGGPKSPQRRRLT